MSACVSDVSQNHKTLPIVTTHEIVTLNQSVAQTFTVLFTVRPPAESHSMQVQVSKAEWGHELDSVLRGEM